MCADYNGWFLHRLGEQAARQFRLFLAELPDLQLLPLDHAHHDAVQRKLDRYRGRKLTYVDASSLVCLEWRRIREVWGTDTDLTIEGARLRPRLNVSVVSAAASLHPTASTDPRDLPDLPDFTLPYPTHSTYSTHSTHSTYPTHLPYQIPTCPRTDAINFSGS